MAVLEPVAIDALLARELRPGETVRWVGRPVPSIFALTLWLSVLKWAVGVAGGIAFIYILASIVVFVGLKLELPILGSVPVGLGVFVITFAITGLLIHARIRRQAAGMIYAITDKRAVIIHQSPLQIDSYGPYGIWNIRVQPLWDGIGHLTFAKRYMEDGYLKEVGDFRHVEGLPRIHAIRVLKIANPALSWISAPPEGIGFYAIADVNSVETVLRGTLKKREPA